MRSRSNAYSQIFFWCLFLSLLAGATWYDAIGLSAQEPASATIKAIERGVFFTIGGGPGFIARSAGIYDYASDVRPWPKSWPTGAVVQLHIAIYVVPFWFIVLVAIYEAIRAIHRRRATSRRAA